jgi:hypothetical protein
VSQPPYTTVESKLKPLLSKIREVGVPKKVTGDWLKNLGFTSSNDATLIRVLKFIGFVDASGAPDPRWSQYRGAEHRKVLASAIRDGYSELFAIYPNAHERLADVEHVFSQQSSSGKQVIGHMVATFRALVELADMATVAPAAEVGPGPVPLPDNARLGGAEVSGGNSRPGLHIDIQVHISAESTPEQIDQIFASMSKHLYPVG